jgi:hypothetical protein
MNKAWQTSSTVSGALPALVPPTAVSDTLQDRTCCLTTAGLGRLQHQPGEPFFKLLISRCIELDLANFAMEGLSGLICVSG